MPIYDINSIKTAGIAPSNKMLKYGNAVDQNGNIVTINPSKLNLDYDSAHYVFKHQNFIETLERYQWINLPPGLTQDIIERVLYFRGKGVLYFNDKVGKFQFLPFALNGVIDEYGRYTRCNTFPFTGVDTDTDTKKGRKQTQRLIYENLDIVYDLPYDEETLDIARNKKVIGIILNDNSIELAQTPLPRNIYVEPVIHLMCTLMQIINTAMYGCADHSLIQTENESEFDSLNMQIDAINNDILRGKRFTAIVGKLPIIPIKTNNTANLEGLFNTFNSLSNLLKSITGIANSGIFDKKAHLLQEEQALNGSNSDDIYYNGLRLRQEFCLLVQAYYGYPIWCESKRQMSGKQKEDLILNSAEEEQQNQSMGENENV